MKNIIYIICLIVLIACDSENVSDCIQASGDIIEKEFTVRRFRKVVAGKGVSLIVSQGETRSVIVQTGENLMNEVRAVVIGDTLQLNDMNNCNLVRDYGLIKIFVTAPNITEIHNRSGLNIYSEGLITFPELSLISDDPDGLGEIQVNGDFIFDDLDVDNLMINANGLSKFFLKGEAFNCSFQAADGDVRIDASELVIQNLFLFHRSTNKMIVNPQQSIVGEIFGLGDVISLTKPPIVEVEEFYRGRLIFQ
ncbi:MAG: DUF2807 domain-containing protein [Flavobacteriaceae bacterium]